MAASEPGAGHSRGAAPLPSCSVDTLHPQLAVCRHKHEAREGFSRVLWWPTPAPCLGPSYCCSSLSELKAIQRRRPRNLGFVYAFWSGPLHQLAPRTR